MSRVMTQPTPQSPQMMPQGKGPMMLTHDMIAKRAYEKWCKRGRPIGSPMQDWLEAEAELKREMGMMAQSGVTPGQR